MYGMQALQGLRPGVPETLSSELDKLGDSKSDIPVSDEVKAGVWILKLPPLVWLVHTGVVGKGENDRNRNDEIEGRRKG
jgi:hypothetical protein